MTEPMIDDVNARAKSGIKLLLGRQAAIQVLTFGAGIVLARILTPAEFGLFAIATFLVATFELLGRFGIAPSLIQRKEELNDRDLRVAFTLQQLTTTAVFVALFASAPWLASFYPDAPAETVWLIRALAFGLFLTSWRSMSTLQLERDLRYRPLAWIEVVEALSYQALAVGLAFAGYGVWSFVWATLARGVLGTVLTYAVAPWPFRLAFDIDIARRMLRFGIPFQLQSLTNLTSNWVTPVLVGILSGPHAVGLITWASSNGRKPLVITQSAMRVAFPHFSRLQEDRAEVERTLERYLAYLLLPAGLWLAVIVTAGPSLVPVLYTDKWSPGVPALMLFAAAMLGDVYSSVLSVSLIGLGRVGRVARISLARNGLFVAVAVSLLLPIGFIAVPLAYLVSTGLAVPVLIQSFGRGAFRRLLMPFVRLLLPVGAGILVGASVLLTPLEGAERPILTASVTVIAYVGAAWRSHRAALRLSAARSLKPTVPLPVSER